MTNADLAQLGRKMKHRIARWFILRVAQLTGGGVIYADRLAVTPRGVTLGHYGLVTNCMIEPGSALDS